MVTKPLRGSRWQQTGKGICRNKPKRFKFNFGEISTLSPKDLANKLNNLLNDSVLAEIHNALGQKASQMVTDRTKSGFGVKKNNSGETQLKPLSPKYIEQRKKLKSRGKLSSETTPNKSNLMKTGEMLNDIIYKSNSKEAVVFIKEEKNKKKAIRGKKERPFMNLSKNEIQELTNIVNEKIKIDITKKGL